MKRKFVGGKGFDLWLMWQSLPHDHVVKWNDPENEICIASGALGGSCFYPGAGKSIVTTISPLTGIIIDSNVGGYFGPYLKFAGFDALEIQGKADRDVLVVIDGVSKEVRIETAAGLPEDSHLLTQELTRRYAKEDSESARQHVSVVSTGPAACHARMGILNFSWYSPKRKWASYKQAGRGGIGTVFSGKNLRAIVCISPRFRSTENQPADLERLKRAGKAHHAEIIHNDPLQNEMRAVGTGHLPEIMNDYELLPVRNYQYGSHRTLAGDEFPYNREVWREIMDPGKGADGCWLGCSVSCSHITRGHEVRTGPYRGETVIVDGPEYETIAGCGSNWGVWDPAWVLEANFYCDTYGLDTISVGTSIAFVMECFEAGILDETRTGGLTLKFGNAREAMELIHQMAQGEGFGQLVGQGIREMKRVFVEKYGADQTFLHDIGMEHKGLEFSEYVTKESLAQQGGYCLTLKGPQHDEAWLIFEDMVRNTIPSFEDKAQALCWFPFWRTWFGLAGLCKLPWNDIVPLDNNDNPIKDSATGNLLRATIPKHVQYYAEYFSAMTGIESTPADLLKMSERVYNFQRAFNIRLGKGLREQDSNPPYRAMGPVTPPEYKSREEYYDKILRDTLEVAPEQKEIAEKIALLREHRLAQYEKLQDAVYAQRGWTRGGCPTIEKLEELEIAFPDVLATITPHLKD